MTNPYNQPPENPHGPGQPAPVWGQNHAAPPEPPKRKWTPFKTGLFGCLGLVVAGLVVFGGCAVLGTGAMVAATDPSPSASQAVEAEESSSPQPEEKPKPAKWTTVETLKGTGNKRGEVFTLGDGDKRLVYSVEDTSGMDMVVAAIYVVAEGESLNEAGGFPEVTVDRSGKDKTQLAQSAGRYYLDVQAANSKWTVKVQEKK